MMKETVEMIEKIATGQIYRCPKCGEFIEYTDIDDSYTCKSCGSEMEFNDLVCFDFIDFCQLLSDDAMADIIDELKEEWEL